MNTAGYDPAWDQLTAAVARVTHDTRAGHDRAGLPVAEAVAEVCASLDFEDLQTLVETGAMRGDLAAAYATVLDNAAEASTPATTSHAEGILDGQFGSMWWEPGDESPAEAECAAAVAATAEAVAQAHAEGDTDVVGVVVVEDVEAACDEDGGF